MSRRYPAAVAAALSMTVPAASASEYLSVQSAKTALRKHERKDIRGAYIDGYKIVSVKRTGPRRVRFYVKSWLGDPRHEHLSFDGSVGVWLRDGKTVIRYPGNRRG